MKRIKLDSGLEEVAIGNGVLRFNPRDPNLYVRFQQAVEKLQAAEAELVAKAPQDGIAAVELLHSADEKMKGILNWVFGPGNDFHEILGGVNLLAVAKNGERVVTNLFAALEPVLLEGLRSAPRRRRLTFGASDDGSLESAPKSESGRKRCGDLRGFPGCFAGVFLLFIP